jgi:sporulation protein YlmC with PRC-barrel domain
MMMAKTARFVIGAEVSCSDGSCGQVRRVVVDPVAEAVTHLAVGPDHPHGLGRLVPVDLIDATAGEIRLRCTLAEFARLSWAKETHFLPKSGVYPGYAQGQVFSWPYYGVGARLGPLHMGNLQQIVAYDSVPLGEVEIRRGDRVHATDGDIGLVQGLVIDPRNHHVTHVLLQEGHLWGRKQVAIPVSSVASAGDGIQLTITKQEVRDLPPVDIDHPDGTPAGGQDTDDRSGH